LVSTHGASKIKHLIALKKLFVRETREDKRKGSSSGGAKWNEELVHCPHEYLESSHLAYRNPYPYVGRSSQVYFVPTLTTFALPFTLPFIDVSFTFPTSITLHLNVNEDSDIESGEEDGGRSSQKDGDAGKRNGQNAGQISVQGERGKTYVVTKWEERGPLDTIVGFGGKTIEKL